MHRIVQVLRESRVALNPVDLQAGMDGTAAADANRISELFLAGRLPDQAVVRPLATALQFFGMTRTMPSTASPSSSLVSSKPICPG